MKNEVQVRLAQSSEQRELEELQLRASLNNPGDREALLTNPDAVALPIEQINAGQVFVADAGGLIKGFAAILAREDGNLELDALFVEPDTWRQGIGRELVGYCVQAARAQGARAIHVVGNPHAEGFYKACGFEVLGTEKTQFGTGLLMRRLL